MIRDPDRAEVLEQLDRVVGSPGFSASARLVRFLRFVVLETLDQAGSRLKESVIGVEVFDRDASYDPRTDSVVRVEAGRLRSKLREYYAGSGRLDPVEIELPKGGYGAIFRLRGKAAEPAPPKRSPRHWIRLGWAGGLLLLLAGAGAVWWLWPGATTVVVLPLQRISADSEDAVFSAGLQEEIETALSRVAGLRVIGHSAAEDFLRQHQDPVALSERVGARCYLEGAVRHEDQRVRVTMRLVDAQDRHQVWSETYERGLGSIFALQDEIAGAVAGALAVRFADRSQRVIRTRHSEDQEARILYWRALYHRRQPLLGELPQATEKLEQAVARDPGYAAAWAALADAYALRRFHNLGPGSPEELASRAVNAAERALRLDSDQSEAYAARGLVAFYHRRDARLAEDDFRRAIETNPNAARIHNAYALVLAALGRHHQAQREAQRAQELDPLSFVAANDLGVIAYCARRFEECAARARQSLEADPRFYPARSLLGICLAGAGQNAAAARELRAGLEASGARDTYLLGRLASALARSGHPEEARTLLAEVEAALAAGKPAQTHAAYALAGLGERDRALERLRLAAQAHETDLAFVRVDAVFDPLRPAPGFSALLSRFGY